MIEKRCKTCKELLPLSCFAKHPSCKYGVTSDCKKCRNAWQREYFRRNPGKKKEQDRKTYLKNIEKRKVRARQYRHDNAELKRIQDAEYRRNNSERLKQYFKDHYIRNRQKKIADAIRYAQENREKRSAYLRKYQEENRDILRAKTRELKRTKRDQYKIYGLNYIARKNSAEGYYSVEQWVTLCDFFNGICPSCNKMVASFQVDHIIPLTWEGTSNWITNIQPLCKACNTGKSNHRATDYRHKCVKAWAREQLYWQQIGVAI